MIEQLNDIDAALTLFANGSQSLWMDGFAMAVTSTLTWLPAAIVLVYVVIHHGEMRDILLTILAIGLCVLIADQIASGIFKPLVARPRPTNDPLLMLNVDVVNDYRGGRFGFFSSHAANTFAVATFTGLLLRFRPFTYAAVAWALLNGWSRVYLGVHYVGDVLCGTVCGILVGAGLYWAFSRILRHREGALAPSSGIQTSSGYAVADARLLTCTLLALFSYCCLYATFFV